MEEVYNVEGGAMAWQNEYAIGPKEHGMLYLSGSEAPLEIVAVAYAMERNLGAFFVQMASSTESAAIADTFKQLARFERDHQSLLFKIAKKLDPSLKGEEELEGWTAVEALEGGMTAEAFMELNKGYLRTNQGVIEAAMMIEAQALDLYMRYADTTGNDEAQKLLERLAQEEKNHLKLLGRLMDKKIVSRPPRVK
jgi:rubrerythrin